LSAQKEKLGAVSGVREAHLFTLDAASGFCYASGREASFWTRKPPCPAWCSARIFLSGRGFGEHPNKRERIFLSIACKKYPEFSIVNEILKFYIHTTTYEESAYQKSAFLLALPYHATIQLNTSKGDVPE